jgi:endonuclease/exonuclease/phosphatase family metal-dependent hydrolase
VTRPGLALTVDLDGGRQLSVLNLHLKAGCRQGRMNEATSRSPERAFRRQADCAVLQRQVPAIEEWADAKLRARHAVIIAGDFNRDLLREIRDRMPARADGSSPAKPAAPATIASLVAELSDEDPPAAWFTLARAKRYPRLAECHRHIDGFLLSRNLEAWLTIPLRQLATEVLAFIEPVSIERVRPSDHCPHLLHLPFEVTDRRR